MNSIELIHCYQSLGCSDEIKCAIASRVYLDLKDVIKAKNLKYLYSEELDLIYFHGKRQNALTEVIIPMSNCTEIDFLKFEEIQRKLGGDTKCVTMAICDPNSTVLYYSVANNFVEK